MKIREVCEELFHDYEIDPFETTKASPYWLHGIIRVRKLKTLTPCGYKYKPAIIECNGLKHLSAEDAEQIIQGLHLACGYARALDVKYKEEINVLHGE